MAISIVLYFQETQHSPMQTQILCTEYRYIADTLAACSLNHRSRSLPVGSWLYHTYFEPSMGFSVLVLDHLFYLLILLRYNAVMLGFTLLAINNFLSASYAIGGVFFCLSLGFKQMALYYAPAVFAYLLGKCFQEPNGYAYWALYIDSPTLIHGFSAFLTNASYFHSRIEFPSSSASVSPSSPHFPPFCCLGFPLSTQSCRSFTASFRSLVGYTRTRWPTSGVLPV